MTRVLLIADTERVQRIFQAMADLGTLQLQIASTLPLGEHELTASSPEFTFVQSRISGFSSDILLRHLDKMLPSGGKLVLLAADSEDAAHAKRHGRTSLDLTMTDAVLERSVAALLAGMQLPEPPAQEAPGTRRGPARLKEVSAAGITAAAGGEGEAQGEEAVPSRAFVPFQPKTFESEDLQAATQEPGAPRPGGAGEYPTAPRATGKAAASAFEEAMQQAEAGIDAMLEVEDHIEVRKGGAGAGFRQTGPATSPVDDTAAVGVGEYAGETVAEALRKAQQVKRRRPYIFIVLVLLLVALPLVSYMAGKRSATSQEKTANSVPAPASVGGSAEKPGPVSAAPVQGGTPGQTPAVQPPPVQPGSAEPAKPQAAAKKGVEKLPEMLEGTKLDAEYGRKNPGWSRYVGLRAEYKLFREGNLYRAIQVIPVSGGTISDDLFKSVLRQFGGVESYRVQSRASKEGYVIEQCAASESVALTIYRHKDSSKVKGLVVYYR